ncbi:MAG: DNA/RNA nuclease SfsA [Thermoplasmata archaeon]|nr:DNA/RNA nuclease SfsA [Thermoplasmata archaeon]
MTVSVDYPLPTEPVRFLGRPNRYLAKVAPLEGGPSFDAHVPNPGRMRELLIPGVTTGFALPVPSSHRKTSHTLVSVVHDGTLVSIDTLLANRIVEPALAAGAVRGLGRGPWIPEVRWGHQRFDFARRSRVSGEVVHFLEVKSSNLKVGRTAMFPDAPTARGTHHLETLTRLRRRGLRADVVFVVQRADAVQFTPNRALDPKFGVAFDRARAAGVRCSAYRLDVVPGGARWGARIPLVERPPSEDS